jgi:RimJ/RimL family protein N-acetyltransferase
MPFDGFSIISGGQTGADRAVLDWAIEHHVPHGGWCPQGRKAEDGSIDARYQLQETPGTTYAQRTEWNVRDSDATIIISLNRVLAEGSQKTLDWARKYRKPCLHIAQATSHHPPAPLLHRFIQQYGVKRLNIAGPRASEEPGVAAFVKAVLDGLEAELMRDRSPLTPVATARLLLRPFVLEDAPRVAALAGRREIADTTASIPHPYSVEQACEWITSHRQRVMEKKEVTYAITLGKELIGAVSLREIDADHRQAELGNWVGVDWWGHGYATEASQATLNYGFGTLELNRIYAHHMVRNNASGRVLAKLGMRKEGVLRQRIRKWGVYEDVVILAILREEWAKPAPKA